MKPGIVLTSLITSGRCRRRPCRRRSRPGPGRRSPARGTPGRRTPARRAVCSAGRSAGTSNSTASSRYLASKSYQSVPGPQPDLGGQAGLGQRRRRALQHAALDLPADDRGLDDHLRVDGGGGRDARPGLGPVGDLGDADARAGPRRLDEHRQARAARGRLSDRRVGRRRRPRREHHVVAPTGMPGGGEQLLGELLVHRGGAGEDLRTRRTGMPAISSRPWMVPSSP